MSLSFRCQRDGLRSLLGFAGQATRGASVAGPAFGGKVHDYEYGEALSIVGEGCDSCKAEGDAAIEKARRPPA